MGHINWKRVVGGGLAAGFVMNAGEAALHGGLLGQDAAAQFKQFGVPDTPAGWQLPALILITFVLGIASVWLYAAIRPRFGPGAKTALVAGLAVWVIAHLWSGVYLGAGFTGLISARLAFIPVFWGLVEAPLGTLVGAWIYKE
jgi:hypothetical protein